ncbi:MAG TPA: 3-hydroxyacyl-ACP dehydratase FabZ family protein [Thermoanaerobaculia bacterium]
MRFVLLKELHELVPGESVTATQVFSPDDEYLADHFPGFPVVPGTLITEALSQAGGWLIAATLGFARWPLLNMVEKAKFRRFLRPGEELRITARLEALRQGARGSQARIAAEGRVGAERVAEARLLFHAFDPPDLLGGDAEKSAALIAFTRDVVRKLGGDALLARRVTPP